MNELLQRLVDESAELKELLSAQSELSLLSSAEDNSRKTLVLSAASLFEYRITEALLSYADKISNSDRCIISLIRNKAIKRQYHTFFDWENKKLGPFPTLLGEEIGAMLKSACSNSPGKEQSLAFLEIGYLRNCLVHQNYATYNLESSADDIRKLCESADNFVSFVEQLLK
ncbi:MAG TPA: HEPN domain-containing protein [Pseudomonadales bacterium]|nr:HEPN domain-containing protein [Pseudomonadales bacterium]